MFAYLQGWLDLLSLLQKVAFQPFGALAYQRQPFPLSVVG